MTKKIKVLFVAEELATNGAMMSLLALLKALPVDKYESSLFLFDHGGNLMNELPSNVKVLPEKLAYSIHRLPTKQAIVKAVKHGRFDLIIYRMLLSLQRRWKLKYNMWSWLPEVDGEYDVVISYSDGFVAPMILRKVTSGKKCCWVHVPYTHMPLYDYEYEALRKADVCATVSNDVGDALNKVLHGVSAPQHIVHNIIDAETCIMRAQEQCEEPHKDGVKRIVSVGRVTPAKGFEVICPTAKLLQEQNQHFEWYILGDGEELQKFRQMAIDMNVVENVHFVGNKSNPMPWVKSADVVVQPSTFESWGMTVSEALCLGKAVITSDLPVFAEQITNGVNGIMRPAKPSYFVEAIKDVLTDDAFRNKLETNAANYPFTKEIVVREFDQLMKKLNIYPE